MIFVGYTCGSAMGTMVRAAIRVGLPGLVSWAWIEWDSATRVHSPTLLKLYHWFMKTQRCSGSPDFKLYTPLTCIKLNAIAEQGATSLTYHYLLKGPYIPTIILSKVALPTHPPLYLRGPYLPIVLPAQLGPFLPIHPPT